MADENSTKSVSTSESEAHLEDKLKQAQTKAEKEHEQVEEKARENVVTSEAEKVSSSGGSKKKNKVDVLLKATGDAPIMKKKKWAVDATKPVSYLIEFIRKYIKCDPADSLFIYVNQTFVPAPDQVISNLYECFGADGKLVLHYCKSQAWG